MSILAGFIGELAEVHQARRIEPATCVLIARTILASFTLNDVYEQRDTLRSSRHIAEAVRYQGGLGVVNILDVLKGVEGIRPGSEPHGIAKAFMEPVLLEAPERTPEELAESRQRIKDITGAIF